LLEEHILKPTKACCVANLLIGAPMQTAWFYNIHPWKA